MTLLQSGATIQAPILDGRVEPLRTLLTSIGDAVDSNPHIDFSKLPSAHFLTWFIVETGAPAPYLIFELNVDGPVSVFLDQLVANAGPGIDLIFQHCAGYPAEGSSAAAKVVAYLLNANIGYHCYYIGWRGLTVDRIRNERALRAQIETFLDDLGEPILTTSTPAAIRKRIQDYVSSQSDLAWAKTFPPRPFLVRCRTQVLTLIVGLLIALLALAAWGTMRYGPWPLIVVAAILGGVFVTLRVKEETDPVSGAEPNYEQVMTVTTRENQVVQNHFASVRALKPGFFRYALLRTVLGFIHVLAAVYANQGNLSGITSIHFARWVVVDRRKNLLFLSNYDGSWENYLDDFIDRASPGLTAVWSNTVGFPKTTSLVNGGAKDELLFKTIVRESQQLSLLWYSAYPDLSIQNIQTNAALREGLFARMTPAQERAWLKCF